MTSDRQLFFFALPVKHSFFSLIIEPLFTRGTTFHVTQVEINSSQPTLPFCAIRVIQGPVTASGMSPGRASFRAQDLCSQRGLHPQECFSIGSFSTATVLTFLITFRQEALYFHVVQGPAIYVAYPKCMCKFLQSNNIPWFTAGIVS